MRSVENLKWWVIAFAVVAGAIITIAILYPGSEPQDTQEADTKTGPRIALTCEHTVDSNADPIFKPTTMPPAHPHNFYGPDQVDNSTTSADLLATGTHCKQPEDHSAWWRPALTWGGEPLKPANKLVIYGEVTSRETAESVRPWPAGFRDVSRTAVFQCGSGDWKNRPPATCNADKLEIRMFYDQCVDTTNAAVEENTSGATDGRCKAPFSLMVPKLQSTGTYFLPKADGPLRVYGNSGIGDYTTMHEDFMNGWNQDKLREMVGLCLRQTGQNETRPEVCRTSNNREQADV